ncbi:hypothetical protein Q4488_13920 [Amphritea sp. 1_MG-2023]|uniref:hypothetical protein n=1 Tax=Amphritea sp. 1_MG-2023 TaxID=3062670 RepID=UPI0026E38750|nr:hypothetical protein [Amphritea sp. 1_MG-2023]MDO6564483.1 hypothetical protein [Amphritea sp. 1_MG-2023]
MSKPSMPKIKLEVVLQDVGTHLRQQRYDIALLTLQKLLQAAMAQQFPLVLQRYISELVFECLEQAGEEEAALDYCERAIGEYEARTDTAQVSEAVENDLAVLRFRRICLLVKLDQHQQARDAVIEYQQRSALQDKIRYNKAFTRILKYSKATKNQLLKEQKRMGSFQLSQQLIVSG